MLKFNIDTKNYILIKNNLHLGLHLTLSVSMTVTGISIWFRSVKLACLIFCGIDGIETHRRGALTFLLWNLLKWYDKLCLQKPFFILLMCSCSLILSSLVVLPTCWRPHLHSKRYVTSVVPHVKLGYFISLL